MSDSQAEDPQAKVEGTLSSLEAGVEGSTLSVPDVVESTGSLRLKA